MRRLHLIIVGDVVGVGYRAWVTREAKSLSLTGWVKNRQDKTVELVAEGAEESLKKLAASAKKGPDVAWVERVDATWLPATSEFVDFEVLY